MWTFGFGYAQSNSSLFARVSACITCGFLAVSKDAHGWKQQNRPHLLCVEDPQDSENDVAKSSFNIFAVRRAFAYGHSLLAARVRTTSSVHESVHAYRHCAKTQCEYQHL